MKSKTTNVAGTPAVVVQRVIRQLFDISNNIVNKRNHFLPAILAAHVLLCGIGVSVYGSTETITIFPSYVRLDSGALTSKLRNCFAPSGNDSELVSFITVKTGSQRLRTATEIGYSVVSISNLGKLAMNQPTNSSPRRSPEHDVKWIYLHWR